MSTFPLRIGTPDGLLFEGNVERVICRSIGGDIAILARHCNFCTALGMGEASVVMEDGTRRTAACIGGMLSVMNGTCRLLATTWEWKEDINEERALAGRSHRPGIQDGICQASESTGASECKRVITGSDVDRSIAPFLNLQCKRCIYGFDIKCYDVFHYHTAGSIWPQERRSGIL